MQEDESRYTKCITLIKENCHNQEVAERACYLQEKLPVGGFDADSSAIIEEARSFCKDCEDYERYTP